VASCQLIPAKLAAAVLTVVALERGRDRHTVLNFQAPQIHDELKYSIHKGMMQDVHTEAMTFRNNRNEVALPIRQWEAFLPGTGLGGAGVHWNGQTWRYHAADFIYKTHIEQRYGKKILDPDLRIQDVGVTYEELEPYYDKFEYLVGAGGIPGIYFGASGLVANTAGDAQHCKPCQMFLGSHAASKWKREYIKYM
jgi:gluconate 2-dehydrogenase alpha chain